MKASAARCDVAVSTAFRWRHRFLAAARSDSEVPRGSWKRTPTSWRAGRARAGWDQGTAAGRLGEEARPFARAGAGSHGGGPERDDGQCCPGSMRRRSRLLSTRWSRRTPCWSPTVARATHAPPPGVSHEALNRSMAGTGSGRSACADGEQPPQPVEGLPASRRGIATRYLDNYLSWFHLVGLAPGANDRACLAAAVTR